MIETKMLRKPSARRWIATRRLFLASGAALLVACSEGRSQQSASSDLDRLRRIGISPAQHGATGDGKTDDLGAFRLAVAAAAAGSRILWIPPAMDGYVLTGELVIPDGFTVLVEGRLIGNIEDARVSLASSTIRFAGAGEFRNCQLRLTGGSPKVYGFTYRGNYLTFGLLIQGTGVYKDIVIDGLDVRDANFGVGRNGLSSAIAGCRIANGYFANLSGDAIQFDQCVNDVDVLVENHRIENINSSGQQFWGMGIGFAGLAYDPIYAAATSVKRFRIRNIVGRRLRQLIHVEIGTDFEISNIEGEEIGPGPSPRSGLEVATIACYGCRNFTITDVRNRRSADAGILLVGGTMGTSWRSATTDFKLSKVALDSGSIVVHAGTSRSRDGREQTSAIALSDIVLKDGGVVVIGRAREMRFERIRTTRRRAAGSAIQLRTDGIGDGRDKFLASPGRVIFHEVSGIDEHGAASTSLEVRSARSVEQTGNSFRVDP